MNYVKCDCGYTYDKDVHKSCPGWDRVPPDLKITEKATLPKQLRRKDDGEIFSLNSDGTYTMDKQRLAMPTTFYRYGYDKLMHDSDSFEVVDNAEPDNQLDSEELKSTHHCKVTLVEVDTTEEFIMNPEFPLKGWRRYRIEYGGCNEDTLVEGIIYLPPRANSQAIVDQIMGMQAHEEIWKVV